MTRIPGSRRAKRPPRWLRIAGLVLLALPLERTLADDVSATDRGREIFRRDVQPILTGKCLACHASDKKKGGLDLSRRALALTGGERGEAIVAGKPDESLLLELLSDGQMPPKNPLKPEQVAAFRSWIEAGAPYESEPLTARRAGPDWWSLQPIRRPEVPSPSQPGWVRNPIDAFILAKLDEHGLKPSSEVDRATYIRRVTFDLTGLPPTPEQIRAFVNDASPDAYETLVDALLASPRYGERWGRHWLDVVRFAESHGYETNQLRPNAWPYRDYVIRAFNEDTPFARFVEEQLAGDARTGGDWLTEAATGFLVGGTHDVVGNQTIEGMRQQRADDLDDIITATGTAFLGLTVNCARCHDHKFDPIGQEDYYGLQAVFAGVQHADREVPAPDAERRREAAAALRSELARIDRELDTLEPLARADLGAPGRPGVNPRRNVDRFEPVAARFVRFTVQATNNGIEPCIDELEIWSSGGEPRNVALAEGGAKPSASSTYPNSDIHRLEHINDGQYGNSRSWISAVPGKGWVGIELPETTVIDRIVWGRDREERYQDRVPTEYYIEVATEPGQWRVVASSADRAAFQAEAMSNELAAQSTEPTERRRRLLDQRKALGERLAELSPTMRVYAGTFSAPGPTHLLTRGDPMQQGKEVPPSALRALGPRLVLETDTPERERRLALARWIADPTNPLPARVMVNRLWHYHFGQGIVNTPSDFGFNGDRPSHPELLDWLASEFLAGGGRLKPIHRLIVLSSTYRQSSRMVEHAMTVDQENRLLWRMNPRRLEAEAIRDAMLWVSGALDLRMGGPGYNLWEKNTNYVVVFTPKNKLGPDEFRRMVYQFKPRSQQDPTFGAFDCPDGGLVAPRRNVSTTALQSLNLLNSRFVIDQAARFAERLRQEAGEDVRAQVRSAFALAFGREPTPVELEKAAELIREHGASSLCRALFNANEFLYVP